MDLNPLPPNEIIISRENDLEYWEIPHRVDSRYLSHNYFRYIGKFPPQLAREFIQRYTKKGGLIMDPMCGGGTVLIEAKIAGFDALGLDVNPVAVLVSRVATTAILPNLLEEFTQQFIRDMTGGMLGPVFTTQVSNSIVPDLFGNEKYYDPQNLQELIVLKTQIDEIDNPQIRDFYTVAFLSIMRQVSQANVKKMNTEIDENKPRRDVWSTFYKKIKEMVIINRSLSDLPKTDIRVELGSATNLQKEDGSVCFVVVHPPYLTNTAFSESVQLQLAWLGIKHTDIWNKELRCRGSYLREKDGLQKYLINWNTILKEIYRTLASNGKCVVVVGDGQIDYVRIPIGQISIEFAKDIGFEVDSIMRHRINNNTGMTLNRKMKDQHIIVLRKN